MKKIVCAPAHLIPKVLNNDTIYFSTYSNPKRNSVGYFGTSLIKHIKKLDIYPKESVWDFTTIALSIAAADRSIIRSDSPDGWTRQMDLTVYLYNPSPWNNIRTLLQNTLRFLTGDFWELRFECEGIRCPTHINRQLKLYEKTSFTEDCVCLLSGGVDSLIGAIDLVETGHHPILSSQIMRGDAVIQKKYAYQIAPQSHHFQWSNNLHLPIKKSERSTRGRSIIFFAFAALAASAIQNYSTTPVDIYIPENGFISLNIPLTPLRMGSLSTKTTHPIYISHIQSIWRAVGINFNLRLPYKFKTKGEMLRECKNQMQLENLVFDSISCGKYKTYKMQHCGRCLPCLVRRAAFHYWNKKDRTKGDYFSKQLKRISHGSSDEVGAAAYACLQAKLRGVNSIIAGNLYFSAHDERRKYERMIAKGIEEIYTFLQKKGVL